MNVFRFSSPAKRTKNANNATHYVKLGKKRRDSSKRNDYITSQRVIIKAIIIICCPWRGVGPGGEQRFWGGVWKDSPSWKDKTRNGNRNPEWSAQIYFQKAQLKKNMNFEHWVSGLIFSGTCCTTKAIVKACQVQKECLGGWCDYVKLEVCMIVAPVYIGLHWLA